MQQDNLHKLKEPGKVSDLPRFSCVVKPSPATSLFDSHPGCLKPQNNNPKEHNMRETATSDNSPVEQIFNYTSLGLSISDVEFLKVKENSMKARTRQTMIDNGNDLIEAKARIAHGAFTKWVEGCLGMDRHRSAEIMRIAKHFKNVSSAFLEQFDKSAMLLLSSKNVSDEARDEALDRAATGEKITAKLAKEIVMQGKNISAKTIPSFVYIITDGNAYKIGISNDVEQRVRTCQTGNPNILKVIYKIFSTNALKVEKKLHKILKDHKTPANNEWVNLSDDILNIVKGILDDASEKQSAKTN